MNIADAIETLERWGAKKADGLPEELFLYISRTTPLVNVDLLIKDENDRTLLAWRDDQYAGVGWHVPGGIVRFKETLETRIEKVAQSEIGTSVEFDDQPIAINEIILRERDTRGHFISLLYRCSLLGKFSPENNHRTSKDPGYLRWHNSCPIDLLKWHQIYRDYL